MQISNKGIALIKRFEGFRANAYQDVVGVWTIGYGTIQYKNGVKVKQGDIISEDGANAELENFINTQIIPTLIKTVRVTLNQNQVDALASFIYNLGASAFTSSTLLKLINQGKFNEAALEFPKWSKAGGKTVQGLVNRRMAEMALFRE